MSEKSYSPELAVSDEHSALKDAEHDITQFPTLNLIKVALDKDAISVTETGKVTVNIEGINAIAGDLPATYPSAKPEAERILRVPEGFDMEKAAKQATRSAIRSVMQEGFVPRPIFTDAIKFAGPSNTEIDDTLEGLGELHLGAHGLIHELRNTFKDEKMPLPVPENVRARNLDIRIRLNPREIEEEANAYMLAAKDGNVPLTDQQALEATLSTVTGHEFGHALEHALEAHGQDILSSAYLLPGESPLHRLRRTNKKVNSEHFARALGTLALLHYLQEEVGYDEERIQSFLEKPSHAYAIGGAVANELLETAQRKGFTPQDIVALDYVIRTSEKVQLPPELQRQQKEALLTFMMYLVPEYNQAEMRTFFTNH